jgi:hypothetical protein
MKTIGICELLDILYPNNSWMHMMYQEYMDTVLNWCTANNYLLYERPKDEMFMFEAVELAELANAEGIVLHSLS